MKISNKREVQQSEFNHSSDIGFQLFFLNLYKKCDAKPYSILLIDAILTSDKSLTFRKNFLEKKNNQQK